MSEYSDRLPDYASGEFRDSDRFVFPDIMQEHYESLTSELIEQFTQFIQSIIIPKSVSELKLDMDNLSPLSHIQLDNNQLSLDLE